MMIGETVDEMERDWPNWQNLGRAQGDRPADVVRQAVGRKPARRLSPTRPPG